jgi:hypothetical protein
MRQAHMAATHAPSIAPHVEQGVAASRLIGTAPGVGARWLEWLLLSSLPLALTLLMKPLLNAFWHAVMAKWSSLLGWTWFVPAVSGHEGKGWWGQADGTFAPSSWALGLTWLGLMSIWVGSGFFSDRFHPLKIALRALCLIQAAACVFFMWTPASFPYTVTRHMASLLDMGYALMLAVGPMLALGWGILKQALLPRILAPLGVLAYFALMLPHKVLLHAWILEKGSILFMPVLFMCFGALLDLWMFIALYAWLASRIPVGAEVRNSEDAA